MDFSLKLMGILNDEALLRVRLFQKGQECKKDG